MSNFFWVCLGGAAGSGSRYLLSTWMSSVFGNALPYGTLAVNLLGSFLIGLILQTAMHSPWPSPTLRLILTTGFLGGFTTYSAFNHETLRYFHEGAVGWGVLYIGLMLFSCLLAGTLGMALARWIAA